MREFDIESQRPAFETAMREAGLSVARASSEYGGQYRRVEERWQGWLAAASRPTSSPALQSDYEALLEFALFVFHQRPCDYEMDFRKMHLELDPALRKILHLVSPDWAPRPNTAVTRDGVAELPGATVGWISPGREMPEVGRTVSCLLQHATSKNIRAVDLVRTVEDDCEWRTADDNSAVDYSWDVIGWRYGF